MDHRSRSLRWLLLQLGLGLAWIVLLACTTYLPLLFFHVLWFLPLALLPRGLLVRLGGT
jgi:hypothetical protein